MQPSSGCRVFRLKNCFYSTGASFSSKTLFSKQVERKDNMIGINDIKGIKITTPEINFQKAIGADYFENLDFPEKYPAFINIHEEKPAVPVPLHWHNGGELIYSRNWNLNISINGEQQALHPGQFVLISPYALHAIIPEQRDEKMQVMSLTMDVDSLAKINANVQYCEISRDAPGATEQMRGDMVALCEKLYEEAEKENHLNEFLMNSIIFEMIGNIMEHFWVKDTAGPRQVSAREHKLKSVLAYISENYKENLSTQSVAEHFGYTREYFCRIFKKYSNMTFKEYLTGVRLDAVLREMRVSKESCAQIALDQGFPDVKGFNGAFKSRYGMSPNQYRKEKLNRQ